MANVNWLWLSVRSSGITAWALLTAVVLWGILLRTRILGRLAPPMRLLDLHRWLGVIALTFLVVHMALLLFDTRLPFTVGALLVPGLGPTPRRLTAALGATAFWLLLPVTFLGRVRAKMGVVGNAWFTRAHLIAYAAWPFATVHYVLAGTDTLTRWSLGLLLVGNALIVTALLARGFVPDPGPHRPISDRDPFTST